MPLVAIDTNVVDLVRDAASTPAHIDCMEALEPPPRFRAMPTQLEAEVWATYWLVSLAPCWRSTVYTFSDSVYDELGPARDASALFRIAWDVLVREQQPTECWTVQSSRRPDVTELEALRLKPADAEHVADAIALGCSAFLTNDKQLRRRGVPVA